MLPKSDTLRTDLLGSDVHTGFVWGLAVALLLLWVVSHRLSARLLQGGGRLAHAAGFLVRVLIGSVAIWAFWQAVSRHLFLETSWSLAFSGFLGALAVEIILALYRLEQRIVSPKLGRWLLGLRLLLAATVLTILVQPVFARDFTRKETRTVVVLMDESGSMQIADQNMTVDERLTLAEFAGVEVLKERSPLPRLFQRAQELSGLLERESIALQTASELSSTASPAGRAEQVTPLIEETLELTRRAEDAMNESRREQRDLPDDLKRLRDGLRRELTGQLREHANNAAKALKDGDAGRLRTELRRASNQISQSMARSAPFLAMVDDLFYKGVPEEARAKIDAVAARNRSSLARDIISRERNGAKSVLAQLEERYGVRVVQFGRSTADAASLSASPPSDALFSSRTDVSGALERVASDYESGELAGVLLLSDCRHNGAIPPGDAARKIGLQGAKICPVVVGSSRGARDVAITSLSAPQSIFLGDRIRVKADIRADGMRGQKLKVILLRDGQPVEEEVLSVPEDYWRTTVRMSHEPKEKGIGSWSLKVESVEGEQFAENNQWNFAAAVSDDRTNVLLVDDRPRWEFRYLRNLFDSRDKSVHLQHVLLHPDELPGAEARPDIPASVSRKFGESEATRLPASAEEWRKFDVIILGDIPPALLGEDVWGHIREAVGSRGAMLVVIGGPNHMPHAYQNATVKELLPVTWNFGPPPPQNEDFSWRFTLTPEGRSSTIFLQSLSGMENARIWEEMPLMSTRNMLTGVRDGASVLAWAQPVKTDVHGNALPIQPAATSGDVAYALKEQKELERRNAVVVASQVNLGKVCFLAFDQTWRFRYGVGDTYHHRFWGQLLRWGAGENLPTGTNLVRMGTDRFTCEPGDRPRVSARLLDEQFRPLAGKEVTVTVWRGDERVMKRDLEWLPDSNGMYAADLDPISEPGDYRLELSGDEVTELLAKEGLKTLEQKLQVTESGNPVEIGDISVDRTAAAALASASGGIVADISAPEAVIPLFGEPGREVTERQETTLWDNWWMLALAVAAATAEWILRRRGGLV